MAWQGFLKESKKFMSYPDGRHGRFAECNHISVLPGGWTTKERFFAKIIFWVKLPKAALIFYWLTVQDYIRKKFHHYLRKSKE